MLNRFVVQNKEDALLLSVFIVAGLANFYLFAKTGVLLFLFAGLGMTLNSSIVFIVSTREKFRAARVVQVDSVTIERSLHRGVSEVLDEAGGFGKTLVNAWVFATPQEVKEDQ